MEQFGLSVDVYDPFAGKDEVKEQYDIDLISNIETIYKSNILYDAIILAVSHAGFNEINFSSISTSKTVVFDTKAVLNRAIVDGRL